MHKARSEIRSCTGEMVWVADTHGHTQVTSFRCPRKRMPEKGHFRAIRLGSLQNQCEIHRWKWSKQEAVVQLGKRCRNDKINRVWWKMSLSHIQEDANRPKTNFFSCCSHMPLMSYRLTAALAGATSTFCLYSPYSVCDQMTCHVHRMAVTVCTYFCISSTLSCSYSLLV